MVPGVVLSRWLFDEHFSRLAMVPVSFAISAGVFGSLGVPFLLLRGRLELYLWIAGAIVAAALTVVVLGMLRRKSPTGSCLPIVLPFSWLWIPFLLLAAILAFMSTARVEAILADMWVYLAWVREFLNAGTLALHEPYFGNEISTLSRVKINGWLLEQAALSRVSGIDPIELILGYLRPTLVVMSLLAFYALARTLFNSEMAALLSGSLYALFFLINLHPTLVSFGGEFIGRVAEDKFVARFLFLPITLIFAFLFLEKRKLRHLVGFALLCWVVVAIHPVGLAIIGLCTAGFGVLYLAVNWLDKGAWIRAVGLGAALLSFLLAPLSYLMATGDSLVAVLQSADISSGDPDVLANMVFVLPHRRKILELGDSYYIMHPSLLLNLAILVALFVGLPFLLWRLKRSLAAQLLVGVLLVSIAVCYLPPLATFFGDHIVSPGQLWRLAWPIPLAAVLSMGWMVWEMTRYGQIGVNEFKGSRRFVQFLPMMVICALIVVAAPVSLANARWVYNTAELPPTVGSRFDPIFRWMQENIKEPSVVLAPNPESTGIPAYSAQANVVSLKGENILQHLDALKQRAPGQIEEPKGALDVRSFFSRSPLEKKLGILRRHEVDYVMVPDDLPLNATLKRQPGFISIDTPGERYNLYAVDRQRLSSKGGLLRTQIS